ncbi:MAG: outer membrane beta-barrel protein [Pseudomonadota bacterium]
MLKLLPALALLAFPGIAAAQSFDGPSVGLQLSYGDADTSGPSLDGEDTLIGLRAYYDVDFGNFIAGGGLQYDSTEIDLDGVADVDDVFRLGARVGVANGPAYFYGTAGFAQASTSGPADAGDSDGYFVGAGAEAFVADNITVGGEILYHEFEDFDIGSLEAEVTTIGFNVNYRF